MYTNKKLSYLLENRIDDGICNRAALVKNTTPGFFKFGASIAHITISLHLLNDVIWN